MALSAQIPEPMIYVKTDCHDFITGWKRAPKHYDALNKAEKDAERYAARKNHKRGGLKRPDCGRKAFAHPVTLKTNIL